MKGTKIYKPAEYFVYVFRLLRFTPFLFLSVPEPALAGKRIITVYVR